MLVEISNILKPGRIMPDVNLKGMATILFDRDDGLKIEIKDHISGEIVCEVKLTPQEAVSALSRCAYTNCKIVRLGHAERYGKKMQHKYHVFPMHVFREGFNIEQGKDKETARILAIETCPEGWTPDLYFGNKDSFFVKDNEWWARCIIRRWVNPEDVLDIEE